MLSPDHSCSCVGLFEHSGCPRGSHTPSQQQPAFGKISCSLRFSWGCTCWVEEPALGRPCPAESLRTRLQCKQGSQMKHEWLSAITYRWLEPVSADGRHGATLALLQAVNDIIVGDKAPLSTPPREAGRLGQRLATSRHGRALHTRADGIRWHKMWGQTQVSQQAAAPKGNTPELPKTAGGCWGCSTAAVLA